MRLQSEDPWLGIRHTLFVSLVTIALLCHWRAVVMLLKSASIHEQYSHILLILPISLSLIFLERRAKSVKIAWSPLAGTALLLTSLLLEWVAQQRPTFSGEDVSLSAKILAFVLCCLGLMVLFYGIQFVKRLLFPVMFLFFIIPLPQFLTDSLILGLQRTSSEATCMLFKMAGVPVLRNGFILSLPTLDVEIAKECSGIRSSMMLLVTSLVLGHLYLRSNWAKVFFALAVIPFAVAKNAIRIFTLLILAINVDPSFLDGRLHHNGGIVFFLLALGGVLLLLKIVRLIENRARQHPWTDPGPPIAGT